MNEFQKAIVTSADNIPSEQVKAGSGTSLQVLISSSDAPNFALRRFRMEPGGGMPKHTNKVEHEQYVLNGQANIGIGEEVFQVKKGDVVFIPKGVPHWYEAQGTENFEFLCIVPNLEDEIKILDK